MMTLLLYPTPKTVQLHIYRMRKQFRDNNETAYFY